MTSIRRDALTGGYAQHQLVRISLLASQPERALDRLEPLLKIPYWLSPGWLRIDPNFAPLGGAIMHSLPRTLTWYLALVAVMVTTSCRWEPAASVTEADSAAIHRAIETSWREMMDGARSLNPDRIRAGYVEQPVVAINGRIVEHYDRDQFDDIRRWLGSLRQFDATYDHVHVQVLSPTAAVATMMHHLRWTDTAGVPGEFNSAWTAVFRQVNGQWKIAYSHESRAVPAGY